MIVIFPLGTWEVDGLVFAIFATSGDMLILWGVFKNNDNTDAGSQAGIAHFIGRRWSLGAGVLGSALGDSMWSNVGGQSQLLTFHPVGSCAREGLSPSLPHQPDLGQGPYLPLQLAECSLSLPFLPQAFAVPENSDP